MNTFGKSLLLWVVAGSVLAQDATPQSAPLDGKPGAFVLVERLIEVEVPLHVISREGRPVADIKQDELHVLDDGKPPSRVVLFSAVHDNPLFTGFLFDTSPSAHASLATFRKVIAAAAPSFLHNDSDRAFLMRFASATVVGQSATSKPNLIAAAAVAETSAAEHPLPGTALFDAVNRACLNQFPARNQDTTSNILILFTDGEDTSSLTSLDEAIATCLRASVSLFVFAPRAKGFSTGTEVLTALTSRTGGQVFHADDPPEDLIKSLDSIEASSRNFYRLIYRLASLRHDGGFHTITAFDLERDVLIRTRSGYFAPKD